LYLIHVALTRSLLTSGSTPTRAVRRRESGVGVYVVPPPALPSMLYVQQELESESRE